jgi:hypothetical protein
MASTTEISTDILAPLTPDELRKIDAYWHACNYLAAGMIYLRANPLLREPLRPDLGIVAFKVAVGQRRRPAVTRARDVHDIQVIFLDQTV